MYTSLYLNELDLGTEKEKVLFDKLNNKNIVITGASGVIGRELVDLMLYFNKKYNGNIGVFAVGRSKEKLSNTFSLFNNGLHILDYDDLFATKWQIDYIVHLASITSSKMFVENPVGVLEESYNLTNNLLKFARDKSVSRFNYVSSVEVYGKPYPNQEKLSEDMHGELLTTNIRNSYPEAKRFCESLTISYAKQYGLNVVISRPTKVFSIVMNKEDKRVFADFARKVVGGENIILKSDGTQRFTYCYGLDACIGLLYTTLFGECGEAYNIGSDLAVGSISDVAKEFACQGGVNVEYHIEDNSKTGYVNVGHCITNNERIFELGYKAYFDLKSGIKNIIEQYRQLK